MAAYVIQSDTNGRNRTLITCGSHAFSDAEKNYSQVEKEGYACVWACEHFHIYIYGQQFKLYTDNKSMVFILSANADAKKRTPLRLVHWKARLVRYNFKAIHISGDSNIADYLSRCLELKQFEKACSTAEKEAVEEIESLCTDTIRRLSTKDISLDEIIKETKQDPTLNLLAKQIISRKNKLDKTLMQYKCIFSELSLSNDGLVTRGERIMLPQSYKSTQDHF